MSMGSKRPKHLRHGKGRISTGVGVRNLDTNPRPSDLETKREYYPFHDYLEDGFILDNELTYHIGEFAYGVALVKDGIPYLAVFEEAFPIRLKILGTTKECYQAYMKATEAE